MLPVTAWKSVFAITAFVAVPAAIFLPKHPAVPPTDTAFSAWPEPDAAGPQYVKPSPFAVPPPKLGRHQKASAVAARPL